MAKVMVVDDAAFMREALRVILERNGHQVVAEAENGLVALSKYAEHNPDVITMDITMPVMDGLEAAREILKVNPKAKVIMITAMGRQSNVKEAIELGVAGFLVKPFREEQVIAALNKIAK